MPWRKNWRKDSRGKRVQLGIGKAIALAYSKQGANVVVNYRSGEDEANKIVEGIKKEGGSAIAVGADVSKEEDVLRLF